MNWHNMQVESVIENLETNPKEGLTNEQVSKKKTQFGLNRFKEKKPESIFISILKVFKDVSVIVLLIAAGLSLFMAIKDGHGYIEPFVILSIIILNCVLSVTQERSAEKALDALKNLNSPTCIVIREGKKMTIDTSELVPGDIVMLKTGDLVPADGRLIISEGFSVDESSLTGESEPSEKDFTTLLNENASLGDQINMVFGGCLVMSGHARVCITNTGMNTQMGKIAEFLTTTKKKKTPLQKRLDKIGKIISGIALLAAVTLLVIGLIEKMEIWSLIMLTIALAVAAVPETLTLIVNLILVEGVKKMVSKNAIIRKLQAVETLGSTAIICSDKTGTLTQNKMSIKRLWIYGSDPFKDEEIDSEERKWFLSQYLLCSNVYLEKNDKNEEVIIGTATEQAIMRLSIENDINLKMLNKIYKRVLEIPFSSSRKMMSVVVKKTNGKYLVITKGAFDMIPYKKGSFEQLHYINETHEYFAKKALRVIAIATKEIDEIPLNNENIEKDLDFLGFIGIIDPPRPEAAIAVSLAKSAGIRTVMITGDHATTAAAIAVELGIIFANEGVITGVELDKLSDEQLFESVENYNVYARVTPEHKIRIVSAWQARGFIVAMTGDGVNDAPALKAADVGVAMGISGTEVAKSASAMIITDDKFSTIIEAVVEGRNVFSNIRKLVYFLVVCNLAEVVIVLFCKLMKWDMPVTPILLLIVNVLCDGIPGIAIAKEKSDMRIMKRKPIGKDESFFGGGLLEVIIQQVVLFSVVTIVAFCIGNFAMIPGIQEASLQVGQTMCFLVLGWTSVLHIFTIRSRNSLFSKSIKENLQLSLSALGMFLVLVLFILVPPIRDALGLTQLDWAHWLIALGLSLIPLIFGEYQKWWDNYKLKVFERNKVKDYHKK